MRKHRSDCFADEARNGAEARELCNDLDLLTIRTFTCEQHWLCAAVRHHSVKPDRFNLIKHCSSPSLALVANRLSRPDTNCFDSGIMQVVRRDLRTFIL